MIAIAKYVGVFLLTASVTFTVLALGSTVNQATAPNFQPQPAAVTVLV